MVELLLGNIFLSANAVLKPKLSSYKTPVYRSVMLSSTLQFAIMVDPLLFGCLFRSATVGLMKLTISSNKFPSQKKPTWIVVVAVILAFCIPGASSLFTGCIDTEGMDVMDLALPGHYLCEGGIRGQCPCPKETFMTWLNYCFGCFPWQVCEEGEQVLYDGDARNNALCLDYINITDPCSSPNPCQSGGTCAIDQTTTSGFTCQCLSGFGGILCETLIDKEAAICPSHYLWILWICGGLTVTIIFIIFIIWVIVFLVKRYS